MQKILYKSHDLRLAHGLFPTPDIHGINKPGLHNHPNNCEILCIHQGKGHIHIEGNKYPIRSGDLILTRPGELHYIELDPACPYDRSVIYFAPGLFDSMDPERTLLRPFIDREAGKLNKYSPSAYSDTVCAALVQNMLQDNSRISILINLLQLLQKLGSFYGQTSQENAVETLEYKLIRYINEHPEEDFTTQSLCARFFVSRTQLYRRFKKATGTSVGEYISSRRIITAQQLILQGHKPTEIYTMCGFRDYSTFYRAYLKHFGYSPKSETGTATPGME